MFGIGGTEIILILLVALLVFGPENLPQLARKIAGVIREVRRAGEEVRMHVDPDGEIYRATHFPPVPTLPSSYYGNGDTERKHEAKEGDETDERAGHSPETTGDSGANEKTGEAISSPPPHEQVEPPLPGSRGDKKN